MIAKLKNLLELRYRISTQLYLAIGGSVALTVAASLVGWFSFNSVGEAQLRVNESSVPELVAAFGVAQNSGTLVVAAPRLTTAATPEELALVSADIAEARDLLQENLAVLGQQSTGDLRFDRIQANADNLNLNVRAIENRRADILELRARSEALRMELGDLRIQLDDILVPAVDDQLFYTMTGYRDLGQSSADRREYFSESELGNYRHLANLHEDASIAAHLLESAFSVSEGPLLEPLRERFESSAGRIERSAAALEESELRSAVTPLLARLVELGIGEQGGFDLLAEELRLVQVQRNLTALNRDISVDLVANVDGLVSTANASAQQATLASTQATNTGRTLLLTISAISIVCALLIAWFFVGRVLLRRLQMLSDWMRRMAGGDLESQVEIGGRDEVADMAAALEVFRRHALEVQRLNLVEQLANELQGKNDQLENANLQLESTNLQLEGTLEELGRAQDQIVMREKLAALGELTAGVAHEIRNPLNFVKNFSEVSGELLVEMGEVIDESADKIDDDQREYIQEISDDLTQNLERIQSHTNRANRIVQDMLMMGRGSTEPQPTNINSLLDEYSRLAYHSARATDPDFQMEIRQDLDPEMVELEAIPQDLGRVFLNMVGNACYATDEKRRALEEAGGNRGSDRYFPTLWVATKRADDSVEVRIKDNGNGMPAEVVEKIFNPFFTTKPTGQGTGLGLALSNDIIREHGGSIRVETEQGEFTEMIIDLPLVPSASASPVG